MSSSRGSIRAASSRKAGLALAAFFVFLIFGSGVAAAAPAGALDQLSVRSLSSRPEMVSSGNALVEIQVPTTAAAADVTATINGANVTSDFAAVSGETHLLRGLVDGLAAGSNRLAVTLPGYRTQDLILVNHSAIGPILSGRHLNPFVCTTAANGLGAPTDANCSAPTIQIYRYRATGNVFKPLTDPTAPYPADGLMTTTSEGKTVPYAVVTERGVLNRSIYNVSTLIDVGPGSNANRAGSGWNGKMIYQFGGGCNNVFSQHNEGAGVNGNVADGYAVAQSSLNAFGIRCSDAVSAETVSMVKERFNEQYGVIEGTIGSGGSGGSMAQQMINNNYPGLLDASLLSNSFMDNVYAAGNLMDCSVVDNYVDSAGWTEAERHAVKGGGVEVTCDTTFAAFGGGFFDPSDCPASVPATQPGDAATAYDAVTNPTGIRCQIWDANKAVWGTDSGTGFARQVVDNVGLQYGLKALLDGDISAQQFLDLNANAGGLDEDGLPTAERREANPQALKIAYEMGMLNEGGAGYSYTPTIDNRQNRVELEPNGHQTVHALSMRERLENAAGGPVPHVIYTSPNGLPNERLYTILDEWIDNIKADGSDVSKRVKALNNAPSEATDRCFDGDDALIAIEEASLDSGTCGSLYPSHPAPRVIAGGPLANDVLKCQLKAVDPADYGSALTAPQIEELETIFPDGVCDFSKPGVEQEATTDEWRVWSAQTTPETAAPDTAISSSPRPLGPATTADFEFSSSETGSSFQCRFDSTGAFQACDSPVRHRNLAQGSHTFEVRAVDQFGNIDASPAAVRFEVGAIPPDPDPDPDPTPVVRNSTVQVRSNVPRLRGRRVAVPVTCQTRNMDFCRGRVTVRMRGRAIGLRRNRLVSVGSRSYAIKPGRRSVQVKLNGRARRAVNRRGRVQARIIVTTRQGNGSFRTRNAGRTIRRAARR